MSWNKQCPQSLAVSCRYRVVPLISTRVSGYSQITLLIETSRFNVGISENRGPSADEKSFLRYERHGFSNHWQINYCLNSLFTLTTNTLKLCITGPLWGESTFDHMDGAAASIYFKIVTKYTMTSSNGNIFCVTGHLCGEFTGPRWIPRTKASDAGLWCFLWSTPEWTIE